MKKILFLSLIVTLLISCSRNNLNYQELSGSQERQIWDPTIPFGMVFVPQGSFVMGPSDQDVPFANVSTNQRVSVGAFFMDKTEITNNEYRQFVEWVEDSIARHLLNYKNGDNIDWKNDGRRSSASDTTPKPDFNNYFGKLQKKAWKDSINGTNRGNNRKTNEIDDKKKEHFNLCIVDGKEVKDKTKYVYVYEEIDYRKLSADRVKNPERIDKLTKDELKKEENGYVIYHKVQIYPNTLDFQGDYVYSHEETEAEFNFIHQAYDDYPVVGITWEQANAFCHWRTHIMNQFLKKEGEPLLADFRLPTETEWEYAARGGLSLSPYPWGGPYTRNQRGCFLANFKPLRGDYSADGGHKAIKVQSYNPNNYGLYDMSGNVAEWTSTVFDEISGSYTYDMDGDNSNLEDNFDITGDQGGNIQRKVIKGGSWKDIAYFIQTSTRDYEYANESTSYIGFRCVMDFLGRDMKDFQ